MSVTPNHVRRAIGLIAPALVALSAAGVVPTVVATTVLAPAPAAAQSLPSAYALMARHNAAVGGRASLDKYSSLKMTATMSMPAMGLEAAMEVYRAKPNKFLQKIILGAMGEVLQGYDGTVAWATNPMAGAQLLEGEMAEGFRNQADFFSTFQDSANYPTAETVELSDFEGKPCYKVRVVRNKREGFEYFDAATGLLAGISGASASPQGEVQSTTVIAEWADFGGVKFPRRMEQRSVAGTASITWNAVEFDKVDPATFDLPAAVRALIKP